MNHTTCTVTSWRLMKECLLSFSAQPSFVCIVLFVRRVRTLPLKDGAVGSWFQSWLPFVRHLPQIANAHFQCVAVSSSPPPPGDVNSDLFSCAWGKGLCAGYGRAKPQNVGYFFPGYYTYSHVLCVILFNRTDTTCPTCQYGPKHDTTLFFLKMS